MMRFTWATHYLLRIIMIYVNCIFSGIVSQFFLLIKKS
jgi:hypothetical protein